MATDPLLSTGNTLNTTDPTAVNQSVYSAFTADPTASATVAPTTGATAAAPAPPPNPIQVGGSQFSNQDYQNFILNDPGYMGLLAAYRAAEQSENAGIRGAAQKALIQLGEVPQGLESYLDPGQAQMATDNPYSTEALAAQTHQTALRSIANQLAARGGYDSGELTYGVQKEGDRFNQYQANARGQVSDYINGLLSTAANNANQHSIGLAGEMGNAMSRQLALHQNTPASTATWDSASGSYVDAAGNHYNADGSVAANQGATASPPSTGGMTQPANYQPPPNLVDNYVSSQYPGVSPYSAPAYQAPVTTQLAGPHIAARAAGL